MTISTMPHAAARSTAGEAWRTSPAAWAAIAAALALLLLVSWDSLRYMVSLWSSKEEYGYAYIVPAVALFMVWQKRDLLERLPLEGSWAGLAVVVAGLALALVGELATLYVIVQYAVLVVLGGLALTFMGWRGFRLIAAPLALLAFVIPLPDFLYQGVSAQSQLLSSQLGVAIIRLLGISVLLEGNVIDLGTYKLQVAEACNGLRYLFPLMALGFIAACFFRGALWKRIVIFLSTIPITIVMNSVRIAIIGALVEHRGPSMAEGFLHDFEGWVVFMICIAVLVLEMALLARIGARRTSLTQAFALQLPASRPADAARPYRRIPRAFVAALFVLVGTTAAVAALPQRLESALPRKQFVDFPMAVADWRGRPDRIEKIYLDVLKASDYLFANFSAPNRRPVNLYVAYYASQRKGESAHSPRSCIPGGGWEIASLARHEVHGATLNGSPLSVNRALIQKGDERQLVYYWFQQRGRLVTNEYLVKWFLFWDALTRNRTDGALVRILMDVDAKSSVADADAELASFARLVGPRLAEYIPD